MMPSAFETILETLESKTKKTIVFLDGLVMNTDESLRQVHSICTTWRYPSSHDDRRGHENRRLVIVTNMESALNTLKLKSSLKLGEVPRLRFEVSAMTTSASTTNVYLKEPPSTSPVDPWVRTDDHQSVFDVMKISLYSWSLQEYESAVAENTFFWSVCQALNFKFTSTQDASATSLDKRVSSIRDKYFFAGGSARFMFVYDRELVIRTIQEAFQCMRRASDLLDRTSGNAYLGVVNCLRATYPNSDWCIVSVGASRMVATRVGPQSILSLRDMLRVTASVDGFFFDLWFLASLACTGLEYKWRDESESQRWG